MNSSLLGFSKALVFLTLCFAITNAQPLHGQGLAALIEEAEKSLVKIEVMGLEGGSIGSGYVVSADGLVVTNVHVMAGAQKAVASFPDGRRFEIGGSTFIDEARDICIVKLKNATGLQPIKLAQKLPRKGETVTALGSPMGLAFTATTGIVSAIRNGEDLGKDIGDTTMKGTWVQVDASLSPGNSGGPLIDSKGEVVAMSTRASQGRAQNLNFGISVKDINDAIASAASAAETSLVAGVGKIKDHEIGGAGDEPDAIVGKRQVPSSALAGYIQNGRDDFQQLARQVRRETTEQDEIYRLMRKGETGIPSRLNAGPNVLYITAKYRTKTQYFFRSSAIKKRIVGKRAERVGKLKKLKKQLADSSPEEALAALLEDSGPRLDPQEQYSVGFMDGAVVVHAYNDHEILVEYDDAPFLMWVESTAGLSQGQDLDATLAYVAGTETLKIPGKSTMSVTVLQVVTVKQLQKALVDAGLNSAPENDGNAKGFMLWRSTAGTSVEARFLKKVGKIVHLERRDGKVLEVPLNKLSDESRKLAMKLAK